LVLGPFGGLIDNATAAAALLSDLVDQAVDVEQELLFIIGGSKALRNHPGRIRQRRAGTRGGSSRRRENVLDALPVRDRARQGQAARGREGEP
jgi:hypothetical protein